MGSEDYGIPELDAASNALVVLSGMAGKRMPIVHLAPGAPPFDGDGPPVQPPIHAKSILTVRSELSPWRFARLKRHIQAQFGGPPLTEGERLQDFFERSQHSGHAMAGRLRATVVEEPSPVHLWARHAEGDATLTRDERELAQLFGRSLLLNRKRARIGLTSVEEVEVYWCNDCDEWRSNVQDIASPGTKHLGPCKCDAAQEVDAVREVSRG